MLRSLSLLLSFCLLITPGCQKKSPATQESDVTEVETAKAAFQKVLTFKEGQTFNVSVAESADKKVLTIQPAGQTEVNDALSHELSGSVTDAVVADLNGDDFPEVVVFLLGEDSKASVIAYSSNKGKSMSQAFLQDLEEKPDAARGYRGNDMFTVEKDKLLRRFKAFNESDTGNQATGPTRQIEYKLVDGEASRIFRIEKVIEY